MWVASVWFQGKTYETRESSLDPVRILHGETAARDAVVGGLLASQLPEAGLPIWSRASGPPRPSR